MMCTNCVKSCENRGVQLNLRPPLQELWRNSQPMLALSVFAVMLVGLMANHQFPALTWWLTTQQRLGWSDTSAHTILSLPLRCSRWCRSCRGGAVGGCLARDRSGRTPPATASLSSRWPSPATWPT